MPQIETKRTIVRTFTLGDSEALLAYLLRNKDFLAEWSPEREESYFQMGRVEAMIRSQIEESEQMRGYEFGIFKKAEGELIGTIGLTNIVYGPFRSCFLGYKLNGRDQGKGYMGEALDAIVEFAFEELMLHRLEANVMPRNRRSQRVLQKRGFRSEGVSKRYLQINGVWEDHEHYVLLNEDLERRGEYTMVERAIDLMIEYNAPDQRRINHALKVHGFASCIAAAEGCTPERLRVLEVAAVLHDIGIHEAERKHGSTAGPYQEQEGALIARSLLEGSELSDEEVERVVFLVGHHHSLDAVDGLDFQALIEADFVVNADEGGMKAPAIEAFVSKHFKTETGKRIMTKLFPAVS